MQNWDVLILEGDFGFCLRHEGDEMNQLLLFASVLWESNFFSWRKCVTLLKYSKNQSFRSVWKMREKCTLLHLTIIWSRYSSPPTPLNNSYRRKYHNRRRCLLRRVSLIWIRSSVLHMDKNKWFWEEIETEWLKFSFTYSFETLLKHNPFYRKI